MYHEDSIDQFLHLMRDDQVITDLGKMSIAWIICQSEGKSKMAVPQGTAFQHYEETWLNIFGKTLFDGVSRSTITKALSMVSIICFNYDRCIETHLMRVLQTRFRLTSDQAAAEISNFSIVHPYGQIGALPWQTHDAPEVSFGDTDQMARCLHLMPGQLRTFTETDYSDLTMKANLTTMMSEAKRVIFLGFSYNDLNMDLLQKHGQLRTTDCSGTIKSMPSSAVERAKRLVARLVSDIVVEGDRSIRVQAAFERFDMSCYKFLSERRALLTMPTSGLSYP